MRNFHCYLFIAFFLSHQAMAEAFDPGVVQTLEAANHQKLIPDYSQDICSTSYKEKNALNECALSLCGPPEKNVSAYITNSNFEKYLNEDLKKEMEPIVPLISKSFDKIKKEKLDAIASIEKYLIKDGILNVDPKNWSQSFQAKITNDIFAPFFTLDIDLKKPINERVILKIKNDIEMKPGFKNELENYVKNYSKYIQNNPDESNQRGIYSTEEFRQIAADKLNKFKKLYTDSSAKLSNEKRNSAALEIKTLEKDIASEMFLPYFASATLKNLENSFLNVLPPDLKTPSHPICIESSTCKKLMSEKVASMNLESKIKKIKQDLTNPNVKSHAENRCKSQVVSMLNSASNLAKAEKLVELVKKDMKKKVLSKFSSHSKKILENYLDTKIETTSADLNQIFQEGAQSLQLKSTFKSFVENDLSKEQAVNQEGAIEALDEISRVDDETDIFSDSKLPCSVGIRSNAWDKYLSYNATKDAELEGEKVYDQLAPRDHIFISDFSCHNELQGKSVIAHELGHAINQIFMTQKLSKESAQFYNKLRKCATENYVEFAPSLVFGSFEGDSIKTEEDTADLFAFMAYPDKANLFSCSLIKPNIQESAYTDLDFGLESDDSHSSSVLRLIMEAINKDRILPPTCQRAMSPMKNKLRFKKCVP